MRIHYECTGGYANLRLVLNIDTDELPPLVATELLNLVEASGIFAVQPEQVAPESHGPPDVFLYQLSLSGGGRAQSLVMNDVTVPVTLRPLLTFLQSLAFKEKQRK